MKEKKENIPNNFSKKYKIWLIVFFITFLALMVRIGWLQFVQGAWLKERAYKQQTINQIISPKRGTIYDSTGKKLALSSQVDTVTINPTRIKGDSDEETKQKKELLAKGLSEIFELDYTETLEKVNSTSSVQTIAKKVNKDKIDELEAWMKANKFTTGINIDEDTKRAYPYNTLAANLIGFCGTDNNGLQGIEKKWDDVLTGTPGKIVTSKDAIQEEIPDQGQTYISPENGSDIVLSIDVNIQTIIEEYLKEAVEDNDCEFGGTAIAMNPSTGDILAMASYPTYDLNSPYEINSETLKSIWDTLDSQTKSDNLEQMWRNRLVRDTYEPGSTFKLITAAIALEENITSEDVSNDFLCTGVEKVAGESIRCWRTNPHGPETLREALENSCNPALMQLGKRIGSSTLYKYYNAFGLFSKTGIATQGEGNSIFFNPDKIGPVELATMSFGQRINVTPIQLMAAVCAIVNDGELIQPRIVKQVINSDTGAITNIEPVKVRQVVSKSTSERMRKLMESVVTDGTGGKAKVAGYSVGGKTGTSEPPVGKKEQGYIASYLAIAPTEKPEIAILLALHKPRGESHQGGTICGPVISKMLTKILPYLGLTSEDVQTAAVEEPESISVSSTITVLDVRNKTVTEAEKILKQAGFTVKCSTSGDKNELVVADQVPSPGTKLTKDSVVLLYTTENTVRTSVNVPNLSGKTYSEAVSSLKEKNLNITCDTSTSGTVAKQSIAAGSSVEEGTVVKVEME